VSISQIGHIIYFTSSDIFFEYRLKERSTSFVPLQD
jgi:hypothetical protein